jgi:hypothetical protein
MGHTVEPELLELLLLGGCWFSIPPLPEVLLPLVLLPLVLLLLEFELELGVGNSGCNLAFSRLMKLED